jgi:transposase-like protein
MTALDRTLVYLTKIKGGRGHLTPEEKLAINVFWRDGVRVPAIARAFGVGKNTIYYNCLTGEAPSYTSTPAINPPEEINQLIEDMGLDEARRRFVTSEMNERINREMEVELDRGRARQSLARPKARRAS